MLPDNRTLVKQFKAIKVLLPPEVRKAGLSICQAYFEGRADSADLYELSQICEQYRMYRPHSLLNSFGITKLIAELQKKLQ